LPASTGVGAAANRHDINLSENAHHQIADLGALPATIRVRVQQISDTVGRGIAREAIL
jgi:hypothetical protein